MNKIDQIIKYLPLSTGILVFLGYINKRAFYGEFGINIYYYVSTSELLLSFLPIIVFVCAFYLFQLFVTSYYFILDNTMKKSKKTRLVNRMRLGSRPFNFYWSFMKKEKFKRLNNFQRGYLISNILLHPRFLRIPILIFISWLVVDNMYSKGTYDSGDINKVIIVTILWLPLFIDLAYFFLKSKFVLSYDVFLIAGSVIWLVFLLNIGNAMRANLIKEGHAEYSLKWTIKGIDYKTSSNLVFIGQTSSHIYFYRCHDEYTLVLKKDNIDFLELKKISYGSIVSRWN